MRVGPRSLCMAFVRTVANECAPRAEPMAPARNCWGNLGWSSFSGGTRRDSTFRLYLTGTAAAHEATDGLENYRPTRDACIAATRSSICRVRFGVMPSMRSTTINCPAVMYLVLPGCDQHFEAGLRPRLHAFGVLHLLGQECFGYAAEGVRELLGDMIACASAFPPRSTRTESGRLRLFRL